MLEVTGLNAWYGEAQALHAVDLRVAAGEVVTLVGRNGAGKTTLVRSVMGLHRQVGGAVSFLGRDVTRVPAHRRARARLGWGPDDPGLYPSPTPGEELVLPPQGSRRGWPPVRG